MLYVDIDDWDSLSMIVYQGIQAGLGTMSFFLLVGYVVSGFCMSCFGLFCLCYEWDCRNVVILAGVSKGTKNLELVVWVICLHSYE